MYPVGVQSLTNGMIFQGVKMLTFNSGSNLKLQLLWFSVNMKKKTSFYTHCCVSKSLVLEVQGLYVVHIQFRIFSKTCLLTSALCYN